MTTAEQPPISPDAPPQRLTTGRVFLGCLALGLVLTTGYVFLIEPYLEVRWAENGPPVDPADLSTPFVWPGMRGPTTVPAAEAKLGDDEPVMGIEVEGRFRAYALKSLSATMRHVVNDIIKDVPVTVTYCDIAKCARAYTSPERGEPLRLGVGGLLSGKLLLHEESRFYWQENGRGIAPGQADLPYQPYPYELTTWKAWRKAHPDTDIYVYEQPELPPSDGPPDPFPFLPGSQPRDQ